MLTCWTSASERARERGLAGLDWKVENAEALSFDAAAFDAYTIAFGIRNVTDIAAALREAHRVLRSRRALLLPGIFDQRMARLRRPVRCLCRQRHPAHRQGGRRRRGQLSLSGRIDPPLPAPRSVPADDRRRRFRPRGGRADPRRAGRHPQRLEDLTGTATHLWRLLKWGRTLARHGALHGVEADPQHAASGPPPRPHRPLRHPDPRQPGLCKGASGDRPGSNQAWPGAVDAAGPGRRARRPRICPSCRTIFRPLRSQRSRRLSRPRSRPSWRISTPASTPSRSAPRRSRRSTGPSPPRGSMSRSRFFAPASRKSSRGRSRPMNGPPRMSKPLAARRRAFARGWSLRISASGPRASSTSSAKRLRRRSCARTWSPSPTSTSPKSTGGGPRGGC